MELELNIIGSEKYEAVYNRIRYLISQKVASHMFSHYFVKIKVDTYDSLPIEKD